MKALLKHLWQTSRVFQISIAVVLVAIVLGATRDGGPRSTSSITPMSLPQVGPINPIPGNLPSDVGGAVKDVADVVKDGTGMAKDVIHVGKKGVGMANDILDVSKDAFGRIIGPQVQPSGPTSPTPNPKAP